jgi:signal transduction histidine kinase
LRNIVLCLLLPLAFGVQAKAAEPPKAILVLEQSDVRGPFYAEVFAGLRSEVNRDASGPVTLYVENLDLDRFGGAAHEQSLDEYLRSKYAERSIGVVVTIGSKALEYAARRRPVLWPGMPIVFGMVDEHEAMRFRDVPNMSGHTVRLSLDDMLTVARAVVPGLKEVVLLGDPLERQPLFGVLRRQLLTVPPGLGVVDMMGVPMSKLLAQIAALPETSAILYLNIYSDGAGTYFPPADALKFIAARANRPIVVTTEAMVGLGGTGGFVMVPSKIGEEAAALALQVLHGVYASSIPVTPSNSTKLIFDSRQLQRWGVADSSLPQGSEIRFRLPNAWEQYRWQIMLAVALVVFQSALVAGLLLERRRRRTAEREVVQHLSEVAHMNRRATAGEFSTSIAHELNQPLSAIFSNVEAAEVVVGSSAPDLPQVQAILADIKRDDRRATEIIQRVKEMIQGAAVDVQELDLNEVVEDVFEFLSSQALTRNVTLKMSLAPESPRVIGDRVQLQQVISNLVVNALDAISEAESDAREIIARTVWFSSNIVHVSIIDSGPGIDCSKINEIFNPFYTTKNSGMGMGLTISRRIIEDHGGRIWVEKRAGRGAEFRFSLTIVSRKKG